MPAALTRPPKPKQFSTDPPMARDLMPATWGSEQERDAMLCAALEAHVKLTALVLRRMVDAWVTRGAA